MSLWGKGATVFTDDGCHGCNMPKVYFPSAYLIRVVGQLEPSPAVTEAGYTLGLSQGQRQKCAKKNLPPQNKAFPSVYQLEGQRFDPQLFQSTYVQLFPGKILNAYSPLMSTSTYLLPSLCLVLVKVIQLLLAKHTLPSVSTSGSV